MKKTLLGIVLIGLALFILLKDFLGLSGLPIWPTVGAVGFGVLAVQNLFDGEWVGAGVLGVLSFHFINSIFDWFTISLGTLILVAILLGLGFGMIFPKSRMTIKGTFFEDVMGNGRSKVNSNTIFGNATRYVNDDNFVNVAGDVIFSSNSIYFDNATILGSTATYSGDVIFSHVTLYVPRNWKVEFMGDKVLSTITINPSGELTDKTLLITGDYVFSGLTVTYI